MESIVVVKCLSRRKREIDPLQKFQLIFIDTLKESLTHILYQRQLSNSNFDEDFLTEGDSSSGRNKNITHSESNHDGRNILIFILVLLSVIFCDVESTIPFVISAWSFRLWLLSLGILLNLMILDWLSTPVVYKLNCSQAVSSRISSEQGSKDISVGLRNFCVLSCDVSLSQCSFSILQVKILHIENRQSEIVQYSDIGNQVQFQIIISHDLRRMEIWRTYDELFSVCNEIGEKMQTSKNRFAQLTPLKKIVKQVKKRDGNLVHSLGANFESVATGRDSEKVDGDSVSHDCLSNEIFDSQLLQRLQSEILSWLKAVQSDLSLCDEDSIRHLLNMPLYLPHNIPAVMMISPDTATTKQRQTSLRSLSQQKKPTPNSISANESTQADKSNRSDTINKNTVLLSDTTGGEPVVEEEDSNVMSADGLSKGSRINDFVFLDQSIEGRRLYRDCSYLHSFKVRGPHYLTDKKKIDAGPAVMKLMFMELFKIDVERFGDRADHIATVGQAHKRVLALTNLVEKPFVLVFNLQLPGDPPISIVSYFVLPPNLREQQGEEYARVLALFDRFIDIPLTSTATATTAQYVPSVASSASVDPLSSKPISSKSPSPANSASSTSVSVDAAVVTTAGDSPSQASSSRVEAKDLVLGQAVEIIENYDGLRRGSVIGEATVIRKDATTVESVNGSPSKRSNSIVNAGSEANSNSSTAAVAHTPLAVVNGKAPPIDRTWADSITDIIWPEPGPQNPGILDRKSFQNMRFKLIPNIVEGPWVIQMAVGATPCLLGQKVVQRYFRGENYFEVDVHVGSSQIANKIITLCRTYGKSFTSNIGLVIQGESDEELPEKLLACIQLDKVDLEIRSDL